MYIFIWIQVVVSWISAGAAQFHLCKWMYIHMYSRVRANTDVYRRVYIDNGYMYTYSFCHLLQQVHHNGTCGYFNMYTYT